MLEVRNDPDRRIIDEGAAARGPSPHRRDTPSFGQQANARSGRMSRPNMSAKRMTGVPRGCVKTQNFLGVTKYYFMRLLLVESQSQI
jgi:hypothetical protein